MLKGKAGGLPKGVWVGLVVVAVALGLYLRNRASNSQSQASTTPPDTTSPPTYVDTSQGGSSSGAPSPYDIQSLLGTNGLPAGFDPTSFSEGITYAQQDLGLGPLGTSDVASNGGGSSAPVNVTITAPPAKGRHTGKPNVSGRRHHKTSTKGQRQTHAKK